MDGPGAARVLLVAGAGGTGRTTIASALADRAARSGATVLITVGHVVDPALTDAPQTYDQVHLNPVTVLATWWESVLRRAPSAAGRSGDASGAGASAAGASGFDPFALEPPEITGFAEAEHLLTLRAIRGYARSGDYRTVVVDGPGFEQMVALLGAPGSMAAYLERVWPRHIRLAGAGIGPGARSGATAAVLLAEPLAGLAEELAAFVADASELELVYVLTTDRVERGRAELAVLEVLGLRPSVLVVNRVVEFDSRFALDLPHPAVRRVQAQLRTADAARTVIDTVADELDRPVAEVAESAPGAPATWDSPVLDSPARPAPPTARVSRVDVGTAELPAYEWALDLPLVDPATIGLGRVEEDLIVEANGVRRRVRLPSVLRRCVVDGASYTEGELRVAFTPDPKVWPRGK